LQCMLMKGIGQSNRTVGQNNVREEARMEDAVCCRASLLQRGRLKRVKKKKGSENIRIGEKWHP
jgi:hypothetical protein